MENTKTCVTYISSVPHPTFRVPRSRKSRRPELNQLLRVFSAALYQLSYTGSQSLIFDLVNHNGEVPAVGVEPTTLRLKGGYSAIELHQHN
jgi:hypothetical protein